MILKHRDRDKQDRGFLQNRISKIIDFGKKADDFLRISEKTDSVNHVNTESSALQITENLKADPFIT